MNSDVVLDEGARPTVTSESANVALPQRAAVLRPRLLNSLSGPIARRLVLTLADQGVVSAASLLTTILIARFAGADTLGIYSIGFTVVVLSGVIHESIVTSPYMVLGLQHTGRRRAQFATAAMRVHRLLTVVLAVALAIAALLLTAAGVAVWQVVAWTLALVIPCTLLREYARRLALAHLQPGLALACDAVACTFQVTLLVALVYTSRLSASAGLLALGAACLAAGSGALWVQRYGFAGRRNLVPEDLQASLRFGTPVLAARVLGVVNAYALHWFLAWQLGTAATGVFVACYTIVLLANPVSLGLGSVWGPHIAHAYAARRRAGLGEAVRTGVLATGGIMFLLCGLLALAGEPLMHLLYGGGEYAGYAITIALLALHTFVGALSTCLFQGLMTLGRSGVNIATHVVSLLITLAVAWPLVTHFSLAGAAAALVIGNVVSTAMQAGMFLVVIRDR